MYNNFRLSDIFLRFQPIADFMKNINTWMWFTANSFGTWVSGRLENQLFWTLLVIFFCQTIAATASFQVLLTMLFSVSFWANMQNTADKFRFQMCKLMMYTMYTVEDQHYIITSKHQKSLKLGKLILFQCLFCLNSVSAKLISFMSIFHRWIFGHFVKKFLKKCGNIDSQISQKSGHFA